MQNKFLLHLVFALPVLLLTACDDGVEPLVTDTTVSANQSAVDNKEQFSTATSSEDPVPADNAEQPEYGSYQLVISTGRIDLNSNQASRSEILQDLARQVGFELVSRGGNDAVVIADLRGIGVAALLSQLLVDIEYSTSYQAQANDKGFRITRLNLGEAREIGEPRTRENYVEPPVDLSVIFPESNPEIFLGHDSEETELAAKLQFGSVEDQIEAVGELSSDPIGMNAAFQMYHQTTSPRVRIAVLELIEAEDNYLARSMIVMSLQSADPEEVEYALAIVDAQNDFSLMPQIEELSFNHYDAGVRQVAKEVLESIAAERERLKAIDGRFGTARVALFFFAVCAWLFGYFADVGAWVSSVAAEYRP